MHFSHYKIIRHYKEQRDDVIWVVLTRLLRYARNDTTGGGDCFAAFAMTEYILAFIYNKKAPLGALR